MSFECCPSLWIANIPLAETQLPVKEQKSKLNFDQKKQLKLQKQFEEHDIYKRKDEIAKAEEEFSIWDSSISPLSQAPPPSCTPDPSELLRRDQFIPKAQSSSSFIERLTLPRLELTPTDFLVMDWDDTLQFDTLACELVNCTLFFGAVELLQQHPIPHILTRNSPTIIREAWKNWTTTDFPSMIPIVSWSELNGSKAPKLKDMILQEKKRRGTENQGDVKRVFFIEDNLENIKDAVRLKDHPDLIGINLILYYIPGQRQRALQQSRQESGFTTAWQQLWFETQKIPTPQLFANPITPTLKPDAPNLYQKTTLLCSHNDFLEHLEIALVKFLEKNKNAPYVLVFPLISRGVEGGSSQFCQKSTWWILQYAYRFLVNTSQPPLDVCALEFAKNKTNYTNMVLVDDGSYSGTQAMWYISEFPEKNTHISTLHLVYAVITPFALSMLNYVNEKLIERSKDHNSDVYFSMLLPMYSSSPTERAYARLVWSHKLPDLASIGEEIPTMLQCPLKETRICIEIPYKQIWKNCYSKIVFPPST